MVDRLEALVPGATSRARSWLGHHLPLSTARWRHPSGRVLLAGDAAGLVNPLTGEGIYYAVASGGCAGRIAAEAAAATNGARGSAAGRAYRTAVGSMLRATLFSSAVAGSLAGQRTVLSAGLRAAKADQAVFDDLVELGLGPGRITPRIVAGLARHVRP